MPRKLTLTVDRDHLTGSLQVSLNERDENDRGFGCRLLGPKYLGASEQLASAELSRRDADAIRAHLDAVFPLETDDAAKAA